jgi:hypothetical protein
MCKRWGPSLLPFELNDDADHFADLAPYSEGDAACQRWGPSFSPFGVNDGNFAPDATAETEATWSDEGEGWWHDQQDDAPWERSRRSVDMTRDYDGGDEDNVHLGKFVGGVWEWQRDAYIEESIVENFTVAVHYPRGQPLGMKCWQCDQWTCVRLPIAAAVSWIEYPCDTDNDHRQFCSSVCAAVFATLAVDMNSPSSTRAALMNDWALAKADAILRRMRQIYWTMIGELPVTSMQMAWWKRESSLRERHVYDAAHPRRASHEGLFAEFDCFAGRVRCRRLNDVQWDVVVVVTVLSRDE